jgi:hypothetical protein
VKPLRSNSFKKVLLLQSFSKFLHPSNIEETIDLLVKLHSQIIKIFDFLKLKNKRAKSVCRAVLRCRLYTFYVGCKLYQKFNSQFEFELNLRTSGQLILQIRNIDFLKLAEKIFIEKQSNTLLCYNGACKFLSYGFLWK